MKTLILHETNKPKNHSPDIIIYFIICEQICSEALFLNFPNQEKRLLFNGSH